MRSASSFPRIVTASPDQFPTNVVRCSNCGDSQARLFSITSPLDGCSTPSGAIVINVL